MDKCPVCSKEFKRKYSRAKQRQIYCSKKCRYIDAPKFVCKCKTCNKTFNVTHLQKNKEYCSLACIQRHPCQLCGEIIKGRKTFQSKEKKYCSRKCASFVNATLRSSKKYVPLGFSETIKKYGKLICERCKIDDENVLCVHHIDNNRQNNDISNLETLCANCHHKEHWGGGDSRKKNVELAHMLAKYT